ncbi:MAG: DUF4097 family beta strand repeat-containing protein [bacterium]
MRRSFALFLALPVVAFMVSAASARSYQYDKVVHKAFDAADLKRISIHAENLRVEGWDVDSVEIHAECHVKGHGWYLGGAEFYDVEFRKSGQSLVITEIDKHDGIFGIMVSRTTDNHFVVRMPRRLAVEVCAEDGHILLHDLNGPVRVEFEDGHLEIRRTSSPDIRIHFEDGSALLSDVQGALEAEFVDGSFRIRDSNLSVLRLEFSDGRAEVEAGIIGEGPYRVEFDDGRFEWIFPSTTAATIEAVTEDGRITADFLGLQKTSYRHVFSHTLGNGGPSVEIETQDGRIVFETAPEMEKQTE